MSGLGLGLCADLDELGDGWICYERQKTANFLQCSLVMVVVMVVLMVVVCMCVCVRV